MLMAFTYRIAAEPPYALILAETPRVAGRAFPVNLAVDFDSVAQALGLKDYRPAPIKAARELTGDKLEPLPIQFDPAAPGAAAGELTVMLPASSAPQRVRVYFTTEQPAFTPPAIPALSVEEAEGTAIFANEYYRVTHDSNHSGGLPSRLEFAATGKACTTFKLNDRIYDADLGGFRLGDDPHPTIEVLSRGPLRAVVRVRARYLQRGHAPDSNPRAEYTFTYYAGSPLIHIDARVSQQRSQLWNELHLWEFNFDDDTFDRWLTGDPAAVDKLISDRKAHAASRWAGLSDGRNVLSVVGGKAMIYDGRGEYGAYLHGPWVEWRNREDHLHVVLFAGSMPEDEMATTLARAATEANTETQVSLTVSALIDQQETLDKAITGLPKARQSHWRWLAQLARRQAKQTTDLPRVISFTRQFAELARRRAPVADADRLLTQASGGVLSLLSNSAVGWAFAGADANLQPVSCIDFISGQELLSESPPPLWEAVLQRPDGTSLNVTACEGRGSFSIPSFGAGELYWKLPPEYGSVNVLVKITLHDAAAAWSLEMSGLQRGWSVREVTFPQVAVGPIGSSPDDDYLLLPQGSGMLLPAPLRAGIDSVMAYPGGWCTFQMMTYYDASAGLYFACHDPLAAAKQIIARCIGDGAGQLLAYRWYAPNMGVADNSFTTPAPAVIQAYHGDWFDATQIYRAWAEKEAKWWPREDAWDRPDTPRWMREVCVWACTGGQAEECVEPVKKFAAAMGAPTAFHWYNWHQIPFDVQYPHYFPVKSGMAEGVRELQGAGVRVMPYINGRLWDTGLEDFKQTAIAAATKNDQGQPYLEDYGSGAQLAPMCPTQQLWQDTVRQIVLRLVREVGVDGVYIDQVAAAAPALCMDETHGHPLGGGHWWTEDGYWPMMRKLRTQLPPEKMITTECNAEPYINCFDGYLTWHWQYQRQVPAFPAIYAGRIQLFGRSYGGDEQPAHQMKIGQQLVFGEQLGWLDPAKVLDQPETLDFLRRAAQTRYALLDFLSWGRMARPPRVDGAIPEVTADWAWQAKTEVTISALQSGAWWSRDGRLLLLFVNVSAKQVSGELVFQPEKYGWPSNAGMTITAPLSKGDRSVEILTGAFRKSLRMEPLEITAFVLRQR